MLSGGATGDDRVDQADDRRRAAELADILVSRHSIGGKHLLQRGEVALVDGAGVAQQQRLDFRLVALAGLGSRWRLGEVMVQPGVEHLVAHFVAAKGDVLVGPGVEPLLDLETKAVVLRLDHPLEPVHHGFVALALLLVAG
ncbi:hypothetical protein D3C85_1510390 [compost metagenome]